MVGPRPPPGPGLGVTFDSPRVGVQGDGREREERGRVHWVVVAGGDETRDT